MSPLCKLFTSTGECYIHTQLLLSWTKIKQQLVYRHRWWRSHFWKVLTCFLLVIDEFTFVFGTHLIYQNWQPLSVQLQLYWLNDKYVVIPPLDILKLLQTHWECHSHMFNMRKTPHFNLRGYESNLLLLVSENKTNSSVSLIQKQNQLKCLITINFPPPLLQTHFFQTCIRYFHCFKVTSQETLAYICAWDPGINLCMRPWDKSVHENLG